MNLEELYNVNGEEKKKKIKPTKLILILISIIIFFIIVIIVTINILKANQFHFFVDGKEISVSDDIYIVQDGTVYLSIKDIAKLVGYEYHNGEYKILSEDPDKCYVENENETATFILGSNQVLKVAPNTNKDYEVHLMEDTVKKINNKLYAPSEAICRGLNITFDYKEKQITIYTMSYLSNYYQDTMKKYGYAQLIDDFNNQKTVLYNMFIVKNSNDKYGVVDLNNNEIIGTKYNDIKFMESTNEFWVKDNQGKVGIIKSNGQTKIRLMYEDIQVLDKLSKYYVVKQNDKYGVIDSSGKSIIYCEYDSIGIDASKFATEDVFNQYLLYEKIIPVSRNGKWGVYNINGKLAIDIVYDSLGCVNENTENGQENNSENSVILIPNYNAIVVCRDNKYGIVDIYGDILVPIACDSIYSVVNNGNKIYYMVRNNETIEIEKNLRPGIIAPNDNNNTLDSNNTTIENNTTNEDNIAVGNNAASQNDV